MATMIAATLRQDTYLLVEWPENIIVPKKVRTSSSGEPTIDFRVKGNYDLGCNAITLPPGQYEIVGKGNLITEEQWKGIVEWYQDSNDSSYDPQYNETTYFDVFKDYETGDEGELNTSAESGHSWIRSLGHVPETTLIFKRIK